jgi:hypothetical protein
MSEDKRLRLLLKQNPCCTDFEIQFFGDRVGAVYVELASGATVQFVFTGDFESDIDRLDRLVDEECGSGRTWL